MASLFPSCAEAARRISHSQESPLPFPSRVGLYLHLAACGFCRRYQKQVRFLRKALAAQPEHFGSLSQQSLSEPARQRLLDALTKSG